MLQSTQPPAGPEQVVAVIIPVYHGVSAMLEDVLDSLDVYIGPYHAVVVDDGTTDGTAAALEEIRSRRPNLTVLRNERNRGWGWGNFLNMGKAALWALEHLDFGVMLKLDHDSLVIGPGLAERLRRVLGDPTERLGLVGCVQPEVDRSIWALRLPAETKSAAREHGYLAVKYGWPWSVQAGVMALGRPLLEAMAEKGWLEGRGVVRLAWGTGGLSEDRLVPILAYALGWRVLDAPFVRSFHGSHMLALTPYHLMREVGLLAIHPVKQGMSHRGKHNTSDNQVVRAYFQELREHDRRAESADQPRGP